MAGVNSNSMLIAKLDRVEKLLASQELKTTLLGSDIDIALRRTNIHNLSRRKKKKCYFGEIIDSNLQQRIIALKFWKFKSF